MPVILGERPPSKSRPPLAALLPPTKAAAPAQAHRLLLVGLLTFVFGLMLGTAWDIYWHSRNLFDTFWTPPHLLMYASVAAAGLFAAACVLRPALRLCFGTAYRLPLVPFPVPGSLMLTLGGVLAALIGGGLDDVWHTTWGLDETRWSLPHSMVSWGILLVTFGLLSCRLSLRAQIPMRGLGAAAWGVLVLGFSMTVFLGPLLLSTTPESMARIASLPGFQGPETQHFFRIVARWDLYRTGALFPALVGLWAGAGIGLLRGLAPRPRFLLETAAAASGAALGLGLATAAYVGTLESPPTWIPPLLLPGALALVALDKGRLSGLPAQVAAGGVLGLLTRLVYGGAPEFIFPSLVAALSLPAGAWIGARLWRVIERPNARSVAWAVPVLGFVVPFLMGIGDLFLRWDVP